MNLTLTGPGAGAVGALLATNPDLAHRAITWRPRFIHALALMLQTREAACPTSARALLKAEPGLFELKTKEMLALCLPSVPPALLPFLDRLGSRLRCADLYRRLATELGDPRLAEWARAAPRRVSNKQLDAILRLGPEFRHPRLMAQIANVGHVALLERMVDVVIERSGAARADVLRSLRETKRSPRRWFEERMENAAFPAYPFPEQPEFQPLASAREMRETARQFENCLDGYIADARAGTHAFYVWHGPPAAVVCLRSFGELGWRLSEVKLRKNRMPSAVMMAAITATFLRQGVLPREVAESAGRSWRPRRRPMAEVDEDEW